MAARRLAGAALSTPVSGERTAGKPWEDDRFYERLARLCQVLTDPKRLRLLDALRDGERSVGDLAAAIEAGSTNVSQHLAVIRDVGLVATRRDGTTIYYRLAYPKILEACDIVHEILRAQLAAAAALLGR